MFYIRENTLIIHKIYGFKSFCHNFQGLFLNTKQLTETDYTTETKNIDYRKEKNSLSIQGREEEEDKYKLK